MKRIIVLGVIVAGMASSVPAASVVTPTSAIQSVHEVNPLQSILGTILVVMRHLYPPYF